MSMRDIRHQDHAIGTLQASLAGERLAHGYIFFGPRGIGKTMTAMAFAKLLLCPSPITIEAPADGLTKSWRDGCGRCDSCKLIDAGNHPDCHRIAKEMINQIAGKERHKATELAIDVVRQELVDKVALHPNLGVGRVFIVHQAHLMSRGAQNAMLKTLEEPPGRTYILLVSDDLSSMLPTIRSRAHAIRFGTLPDDFVRQKLAEAETSQQETHFISRIIPGQLGLALEFHRLGVYDLNERIVKDLSALTLARADDVATELADRAKDLAGRMQENAAADGGASSGESDQTRTATLRLLELVAAVYHDAMRRQLGAAPEELANAAHLPVIDALATRLSLDALRKKIEAVGQAQVYLDSNVNQTLLLSDLMAKLA